MKLIVNVESRAANLVKTTETIDPECPRTNYEDDKLSNKKFRVKGSPYEM